MADFYVGSQDLNLGLHPLIVYALTTEPSFQPLHRNNFSKPIKHGPDKNKWVQKLAWPGFVCINDCCRTSNTVIMLPGKKLSLGSLSQVHYAIVVKERLTIQQRPKLIY